MKTYDIEQQKRDREFLITAPMNEWMEYWKKEKTDIRLYVSAFIHGTELPDSINRDIYHPMCFRLEYKESTGGFHCEWEDKKKSYHDENTFGWETIAYKVPDPLTMFFTEAMRRKYPRLNGKKTGKIPSVNKVKGEFIEYIEHFAKIDSNS
jgi:hypothetical protein